MVLVEFLANHWLGFFAPGVIIGLGVWLYVLPDFLELCMVKFYVQPMQMRLLHYARPNGDRLKVVDPYFAGLKILSIVFGGGLFVGISFTLFALGLFFWISGR